MLDTLDQPQHNISFEHQRQLAKLLAKENIRVRQGNYKTAFFDVKKRVLGLPTWNLESKDVSDLLVGHEVGHAHWTPQDGIKLYHERFGKEAPFDIANVVEDIRIERKILAAFPGLVRAFTKGYTHLLNNDFFKIRGRDVNELNFIDRLNLKGKLRHLINVQFDEWETEVYNKCLKAETYEEVLDICGEIISKLPKDNPSTQEEPFNPGKDSGEDGGDDDSLDIDIRGNTPDPSMNEEDGDKNDSISDQDQNENDKDESGQTTEPFNQDEEAEESLRKENSVGSEGDDDYDYSDAISETQRAFDEELENSQEDWDGTIYADAPSREQIEKCICPLDKVRAGRRVNLSLYNNLMTDLNEDHSWTAFKKDSKKSVALLVREFERKKSAYEYSRAQSSSTGAIDPNKLHSYKYEEQIFKSVTKLATSKDHGMVFFIDWSGSMSRVLHDVIEQALQLAFFCKAIGIPFEVYGFTTGRNWRQEKEILADQVGTTVSLSGTHVFELLNSSICKREFEDACKELFVGSRSWGNTFQSDLESLGGTPLFDTVFIAAEIVNKFRAQHKVQKLHTMFLTDGESSALNYISDDENEKFEKPMVANGEAPKGYYSYSARKEYVRWGNTLIGPDAFRARHRQSTYRQLVLNFKKMTGSSAICFFLGECRDAKSAGITAITHSSKFKATDWYQGTEEYRELRKKCVKDKSRTLFIEDGLGYDGYFIIETSRVRIENTELEVEEDLDYSKAADVNKLAKKFSTQNRDKRTSRVFLSKFSDLIS